MKIGVNTRLLLPGTLEGIGRFAHEVLSRMVQDHPEDQFYFFFDRPYDDRFIYGANVTPVIIKPKARTPLHWYWWFEKSLPKAFNEYKIDVFFSPELYTSLCANTPVLLVAHDIAYHHFPQHFRWYHLWYLKKYTPLFLQKAEKICCVSHATKEDLESVFSLDSNKLFVAENGPTPGFIPVEAAVKKAIRDEITGGLPYFIYLGSIHPRKNIRNLIKAFELFKNECPESGYKLVLVGRIAWKAGRIRKSIQYSPYKKDILHLGQRDDANRLLAGADALIYVSLLEGFGIPILEAFGTKTPVITSNVGAMKEVAGVAALLVNPENPNSIAAGMTKIYTDRATSEMLIVEGLKRITDFSWNFTAKSISQQIKKLKISDPA